MHALHGGVEPIDTPDIKDLVFEEGKPLTVKASFHVVPSFDAGDLTTIEAHHRGTGRPNRRLHGHPEGNQEAGCAARCGRGRR